MIKVQLTTAVTAETPIVLLKPTSFVREQPRIVPKRSALAKKEPCSKMLPT